MLLLLEDGCTGNILYLGISVEEVEVTNRKQIIALATYNLVCRERGERSAGIAFSWASCN